MERGPSWQLESRVGTIASDVSAKDLFVHGSSGPSDPKTHSISSGGQWSRVQARGHPLLFPGGGVPRSRRMASSLTPGKSVSFYAPPKFSPLGVEMGQGFRNHLAQIFPLQMGRLSPREADGANRSALLSGWMTERDSNPGLLVTTKASTPRPFLIACEPRRVFPFLTGRGKKKKK